MIILTSDDGLIRCGDNTYKDAEYRLFHKMPDGTYQQFDLIEEAYKGLYEFAKVMSRPGVNFTEEQKAQIRTMVADGETAKAQRIILDKLKDEFNDGK